MKTRTSRPIHTLKHIILLSYRKYLPKRQQKILSEEYKLRISSIRSSLTHGQPSEGPIVTYS